MKKLLISLIVLLLLSVILWGVAAWVLGAQAEQEFKAYLQNSSQLAGKKVLRIDLLTYKKSLMGANATLQISSDYPLLAERMGELLLDVKIVNGPVFITHSGFDIGNSRWLINVQEGKDQKLDLDALFPHTLPSAIVRIDFDKKAHYSATLETAFAKTNVTGIFDIATEDNRGAATLKDFKLVAHPYQFSAENISLSFQHQKAITTRYKPGTASAQITALKIEHKSLAKPMQLDLKLNSNIAHKNNYLSGFIKVKIKNKLVDDFPVQTAKLSLLFNGLSADGFIAYNEANANLDNLHQQAQWTLEEAGELPEGQDQIWQLYDEIKQASKQLPKSLIALGSESVIQLKASTQNHTAKSVFAGIIKLDSSNPNINSWLSLLNGTAKVKLDDELFSRLKKSLPLANPNFTLQLKNNKLLMLR